MARHRRQARPPNAARTRCGCAGPQRCRASGPRHRRRPTDPGYRQRRGRAPARRARVASSARARADPTPIGMPSLARTAPPAAAPAPARLLQDQAVRAPAQQSCPGEHLRVRARSPASRVRRSRPDPGTRRRGCAGEGHRARRRYQLEVAPGAHRTAASHPGTAPRPHSRTRPRDPRSPVAARRPPGHTPVRPALPRAPPRPGADGLWPGIWMSVGMSACFAEGARCLRSGIDARRIALDRRGRRWAHACRGRPGYGRAR